MELSNSLLNEENKLLKPDTIPDDNLCGTRLEQKKKITVNQDDNKNVEDLNEY